jgi:hypothetical protein
VIWCGVDLRQPRALAMSGSPVSWRARSSLIQFIWKPSEKFVLYSFSPSYAHIPNPVQFLQPRRWSLSLSLMFDGRADFQVCEQSPSCSCLPLFRESGSRSGPMRSKVRLAGTVTMTVKGQFGGAYRTGCESDATAATRKLGKIAFVLTLSAVSILGVRPGKGLAAGRTA